MTITRRRVLTASAGAAALAIAGCSSNSDDDGTGTGDDGTAAAGGDTNTPADGYSLGWQRFGFADTGTYTFEFYAEGSALTSMTWSVLEVGNEEVTVGYEMAVDGMTIGGQNTIPVGAGIEHLDPMAASFFAMTAFHPFTNELTGEELAVGDGWSTTVDGDTVAYDVTGTDTIEGIECYTTQITQNGDVVYEACLAMDHGIALHAAFYEDDGTLAAEQTLVEYSPEPDPSVGEDTDFGGGGDFGGGDFDDFDGGDFGDGDFDDFDGEDFDGFGDGF